METPRLVLLIGAPRSGTTWLQGLLASHPTVVSPQETDLFTRYLQPLEAAWDWQMRGTPDDWKQRRLKGLPSILTEPEFVALGAAFVDSVLDSVLAMKPGATTVLEKSPAHSLAVATIQRFVPAARFVHIVRDGRDVVSSIVAAGRGWGAGWAPCDISSAATMWVEHVRGARLALDAPSGYHEVRYEDLRQLGVASLLPVFEHLGIRLSGAEARQLLDDNGHQAERHRSIAIAGEFAAHADAHEPEGFSGGVNRSWHEWSASERAEFQRHAGELLVELGYEADESWAGSARPRPSADDARRVVARTLRAGATRLARVIEPDPTSDR